MQTFQNAKMKTQLQQFILGLNRFKQQITRAHLTLFGLVPNNFDEGIFESADQYNQYNLEKFYQAVYGKKNEKFDLDVYQQVTFKDVTLFVKQFKDGNRLIRMVYIPAEVYDLSSDEVGPKAYIRMVKKFYLSNLFMKPSATNTIKLVAMDFVTKPSAGLKGKLKGINISDHMNKLFEELKNNFSIGPTTQIFKMTFLFIIEEQRELLVFTSQDSKELNVNEEILFLTNDDQEHPVYRLQNQEKTLKLGNEQVILIKSKNVVTTVNYHHLFHYNSFINYKPILPKNNILDQITSSELWGIIETMIYPLFIVKQKISDNYHLPQEEGQTKEAIKTIEQTKWSNIKSIKNDFVRFNELFGEQQWIESMRNVFIIKDEEESMIMKQNDQKMQNHFDSKEQRQTPITLKQKLSRYSRQFKLYGRFINQQSNFIHSMILDHINSLSKEISETADEIHKATDINRQKESQNKLFQWTKIIIRFIAQLKNHQMFSQFLTFYNSEFYQYLLIIYSQAYSEFCSANKQIYGKMFDLSQKVASLTSTKKQILKIVKSVDSFTQLYKMHTFTGTFQELDDKRSLLEIMFKLLSQNKSQEKDKEVDLKIMGTQYDLGATYLKIALIQEYGHTQSTQLQLALKILYNDLYLKLFIQRKDFEKEFSARVSFNQLELLQKVSGLLKLLNHIDLAIEVQKKLDNITTVENYYNRWMMKYHRLHGQKDHQKIIQICKNAIDYFSIKYEISKVVHFYDLLMKNSLNFQEKNNWKVKRFRYLNCTRDPDWCKKGMEKAEKTLFPITNETNENIIMVYQSVMKK